jgi:beta-lactamase class A
VRAVLPEWKGVKRRHSMSQINLTQEPMAGSEGVRTYFVIGESRTNSDNAITKIYGSFYMAFEIDERTEQVLAFECTHTLDLTQQFLRKLFVGQHFPSINTWLEEVLEHRYGGSSRRAVLVSYRDALKRYRAMRKEGSVIRNSMDIME